MKKGAAFLIFSIVALGTACLFSVNISDFQQVCAGAVPHSNCPKDSGLALFSAHLSSFHTFSSSNSDPFHSSFLLFALIALISLLMQASATAFRMPELVSARRERMLAGFSAGEPYLSWFLGARAPSAFH